MSEYDEFQTPANRDPTAFRSHEKERRTGATVETQKPLSVILDEIEGRANKATEGAWEHCSGGSPFSPAHRIVCGHAVLLYVESEHLNADANFNFVASARTDVPALVKALRRATQALELLNDGSSTRSDISIRIELEQITTILNQGRSVGDNKGSAA